MGKEARRSEARCHSDLMCVYAAGMWSEGLASYPGRSVVPPLCFIGGSERRVALAVFGRSQPRPY